MSLHRERLTRWLNLRRMDSQQEARARARVEHARNAGEVARGLASYLWLGQSAHIDAHGSAAHYHGEPSIYGARNDAIEGVTRLLPLWAAYVGWDGAETALVEPMRAAIARALDNGTNPAHAGYWGNIADRSTLICEAADVALCAWLMRRELDALISHPARARLMAWLAQAVGKETADNNWHLFVAVVDACLTRLESGHRFSSQNRLQRIDTFRMASGCFRDGPDGHVDFYNAWAFHYLNFWLREMECPGLPDAWRDALNAFCAWYRWLFTPGGVPLFGRSLCYRFAAPVPLLAQAIANPGEAVNAADAARHFCNLTHFFTAHGGLHDGCFSQGVLGADVRWLDPYSGPASALWGSRAALLLMVGNRRLGWSEVEATPRLANQADVPAAIDVPGLGARIVIDRTTGQRRVEFIQTGSATPQTARRRSHRDRLRQWLRAQASRPQNNLLDLGWRRFESDLREYR